MNIYSPSQTQLFDRCRWKWYLSRVLGVTESVIGKRDLAAAVGNAIHAGLATCYKEGRTWKADDLIEVADKFYKNELDKMQSDGRQLFGIEEEFAYPEYIRDILKKYIKDDPIPLDWEILGTEHRPDPDNKSYIDLWGRSPRGLWTVDWKNKMKMKAGYIAGELASYDWNWQQYHYIWTIMRHTGVLPDFYRIILNIGAPCTVRYQDFEILSARIERWEVSARQIWRRIDETLEALHELGKEWGGVKSIPIDNPRLHEIVYQSSTHKDGIFKCEFYDLCSLYGGDASETSQFVQVERV